MFTVITFETPNNNKTFKIMDFYTNKKQQIAQLNKDAKTNTIQSVICLLLLFVIPFLPSIHVLGIGIIFVFAFASCIAFASEANDKIVKATELKKRHSL